MALLNSLRFGSLKEERVKYLFEHVVAGIAGYGNCIGIPTVGGEVVFDDSYAGNPLVNAMCVGLINHEDIQKGVASGVGNPVYYVGPPTGRDGIHGATFASEELTAESEAKRPAVQVGDPFMEKLVMESCLELIQSGIVIGIQDMGAAGLTCSSAEMASKAGNGLELVLDEVPQRETGMTPYEMMLSESQERMLFVIEEHNEPIAMEIFERWGVICRKVGRVTDDGRLRLLFDGEVIADMPVRGLVDECPVYHKPSQEPASYADNQALDTPGYPEVTDVNAALLQVLASPSVASKEWVYRQYDSMVRASTAVTPGSRRGSRARARNAQGARDDDGLQRPLCDARSAHGRTHRGVRGGAQYRMLGRRAARHYRQPEFRQSGEAGELLADGAGGRRHGGSVPCAGYAGHRRQCQSL